MNNNLLHRFVQEADQAAFAEIVRAHLPLVYRAALRQVRGDSHAAEDIAQQVFVDFAHKAPRLIEHPCLAGWFYASTRREALQAARSAQRRAQRETQGHLMNENTSDAPWEKIGPVLDEALAELDEHERNGVILRFFAEQDFRSIGRELGLTDNAAQKLVTRALDHLSTALSRRGITSTAAALGVVLGTATAAPSAGLTTSILALAPSASAAGAMTFSSMLLKTAVLATTSAAAFGGGVWFHSHSATVAAPAALPAIVVKTDDSSAELVRVQQQLRDALHRVEVVEDDNARLLDAVQRFKASATKTPATAPGPVSLVGADGYVILPGDTAAKIARAQGISITDLRAANPDVQWAQLKVGQQIRLH